jgi:polysaccharide deacetylase family protein (PEP-CTERM system associated)
MGRLVQGERSKVLSTNHVSGAHEVVNCFSIDVESFSESNVESFPIPSRHLDRPRQNREIEVNVDCILGLLEEHHVKATFFFLGRIARDLPALVRRVAGQRHEIGCHSWEHFRLYGLDPNTFARQLRQAKQLLENASGHPVYGFRAPDFSITQSSLWALDAMREAGFLYDSSVYPFRGHDVYGLAEAPPHIHRLANGLIEWPLATIPILTRRLPVGGGGYFRLYPSGLTELCFSRLNCQRQPCMFYIHPYEIGPAMEPIGGLSLLRRFRHYYRCGRLDGQLDRLLKKFRFAPAIAVLRKMGYIPENITKTETAYV